ncbi:MAG: hypothetical protein JSV96_13190 [Candidatus Aminicenantes bacterium]|nr:MAG: hypothetical protein JSV96_13190 [Candidatus Aminicenantes bacterium]
MKKSHVILLAFFLLFFYSSSAYSADSQRQRFEVTAMAGVTAGFSGTIWKDTKATGRLSLSWYIIPALEIEPNIIVNTEDLVFSLNMNANIPVGKQLVPYVGCGLGVCGHGTLFFNVGGGLKVKILEHLGLRGEFKYLSFDEDGTIYSGRVFLAGIFYSF